MASPFVRHCSECGQRKTSIETVSGKTYYVCFPCDRLPR